MRISYKKEVSLGFQASDPSELKDLDNLHAENKDKVQEELKKLMRPELLNRIDKVIVFRALTKHDILKILDLQIEELKQRLIKHGVSVKLSDSAKKFLLKSGYDARNGVRPLRRLIQDTIEDHIATSILDDKLPKGSIIQVSTKDNKLVYKNITE